MHLVYTFNRMGNYIVLSLADKLLAVGCISPGFTPISTTLATNSTPITLAYVLGFYLGDGYA